MSMFERGQVISGLTNQPETELLQRFLHLFTLVLSHEAIVDVHSHHPIRPQGSVEEGCAHGAVHPTTHQGLREMTRCRAQRWK